MKAAAFAALGALLGYLAGAFYSVGFDISVWSPDCRFRTLMMMGMLAVMGAFTVVTFEAHK